MATKKKRPTKKLKPFTKRTFINGQTIGSEAYVAAKIYEGTISNSRYTDNYALKIADCNNTVRLHGNLNTVAKRQLALERLDAVLDTVQALKDNLIEQFDLNRLKY